MIESVRKKRTKKYGRFIKRIFYDWNKVRNELKRDMIDYEKRFENHYRQDEYHLSMILLYLI